MNPSAAHQHSICGYEGDFESHRVGGEESMDEDTTKKRQSYRTGKETKVEGLWGESRRGSACPTGFEQRV